MSAVAPTLIPIPSEINKKFNGQINAVAAKSSADSCATYNPSVKLYKVRIKLLIINGVAIVKITRLMCPVVIKFCFSKIITYSSIHDIPTAVNTYHEQFHFSVLLKSERGSLCGTRDIFIIAVIGHRFEPKSLTSKTQSGSKKNFQTPANSLLAPSPITAIIESHVPSRSSLHSYKTKKLHALSLPTRLDK